MKYNRLVSFLILLALLTTIIPCSVIAEEPVKLTGLFYKNSLTASFDTLEWLRQAEVAANVDITWQEVTTDFDAVKGAMFAAGQAPDIMIRSVSDADLLTFEGLFADLTPYLSEENTPNITAMLKEFPEILSRITEGNGAIYGLPCFSEFNAETSNVVSGPFWINKLWLDNLGLKMPTTWAEFEAVLQAFKDKDANGDGDTTDEIPFDALQWLSGWSFLQLMTGTGIQLFANAADNMQLLYFAEDGVVKNAYADERYKEFIVWMRELYTKGLIHENFFTKDYDTFVSVSRGNGTTAKVGVFATWDPPAHCGDALADQYVCMPILSADDDVKGTGVFNCFGNALEENRVVLAERCANKEAALRFIDLFYDTGINRTGFGVQSFFGGMNDIDNRLYIDKDTGMVVRVVPNDGVTDLNTYVWQNAWVVYGPYFFKVLPPEQRTWIRTQDQTIEEAGQLDWRTAAVNEAGYGAAYKAMDINDVYWEALLNFTAEELETMDFYQASWVGYAGSMVGPWITGTQDIEADWAEYIATLESYGLSKCTAIRQSAYDVWLAKMK